MADRIIEIGDGFWNVRGSFRIGGVVDIGTQASLVRLSSGGFLFLDAYAAEPDVQQEIDAILGARGELEAIINLHPFHTVHAEAVHARYPDARLYGTQRHHELVPHLPWEPLLSEDAALHEHYSDDLEFTIPDGVDFISDNQSVHFSSVLALHRASATIHSDDTLMYIVLPRLLRLVGLRDSLAFHPTLSLALEKRAGAAAEFRSWVEALVDEWGDAENLCAAHSAALLASGNRGASIGDRILRALKRVEPQLYVHQKRFG